MPEAKESVRLARLEKIVERRRKNPSVFDGNEAQTRVSLIDPILRLCGWDVEKVGHVRVEVPGTGSRRVKTDYILIENNVVVAIIEAKNCEVEINTRSRIWEQVKKNMRARDAKIGIATNGKEWWLKEGDSKPEQILDLTNGSKEDLRTALKNLDNLVRPNLVERCKRAFGMQPVPKRQRKIKRDRE